MTLRRKHLSHGTYFTWRCEHSEGKKDRASERNDGPQQGECVVELCDAPDYAHVRDVAAVELTVLMRELMREFHMAIDRIDGGMRCIARELEDARRNASAMPPPGGTDSNGDGVPDACITRT